MLLFPKTKPIRAYPVLFSDNLPELLGYFIPTATQLQSDKLSHDEDQIFSAPDVLLYTIIVHRDSMYVEILICL